MNSYPKGATDIQDLAYVYDASGNFTSITDNNDTDRNQTYTYDDLNRVLTAAGNFGDITYTYDEVGNRTSKAVNTGTTITDTYTIASTSNQVPQISDGSTGKKHNDLILYII